MAKVKLNALIYDAYGTLFDVFSVEKRLEHHFPGESKAISELWRTKQLEYSWLRSLMGRYRSFWDLTQDALTFSLSALGLSVKEEVVDNLMACYLSLSPFSEVDGALTHLGKTHPQGILSNGSPEMLQTVVDNNGFTPHFKSILSVDPISIFKPDPRVYQLAVDAFGFSREQIGFVSSNAWDVAGAKSFGFKVFWINRAGRPMDNLGHGPDFQISSLDQIDDFLE